jgi:hypothetical protein
MNLNSMELPASLVAGLYPSSLIGSTEEAAKVQPETKPLQKDWKTLGENKKNILVIVDYPGIVHLPDPGLQLLTEILTACKLSLGDVVIANLPNQPGQAWNDFQKKFQSKIVLLFEVEPVDMGLPMNFPHFQVQNFSGTTFLYSPALEKLGEDKILKSKLWVCLRRVFNL